MVVENFRDVGIPCLHLFGVRCGGGNGPPSFLRPYVIVAVFFMNERIQPQRAE